MDIHIRKMVPSDMEQAVALLARWNMAPMAASPECPDPERSGIAVANSFVAVDGERIVGVASYLMLGEGQAETASLAVDPDCKGAGVGYRLQRARLKEMKEKGVRRVRTETDRPETIRWYVDRFGYRVVGKNKKKHPFSLPDVDYWTVLELDLEHYAA